MSETDFVQDARSNARLIAGLLDIDPSQAARLLRAAGHAAIVVDVSKRDADKARDMASEMGALYARLPVANPAALAERAREAAG